MHVEDALCLTAHRQQRYRARAVVFEFDPEARQLFAQVIEYPIRADGARRIACVVSDQRIKVVEDAIEHQRFTSAQRVLLMPNSLMKPSASSTPQSADCAYVAPLALSR